MNIFGKKRRHRVSIEMLYKRYLKVCELVRAATKILTKYGFKNSITSDQKCHDKCLL